MDDSRPNLAGSRLNLNNLKSEGAREGIEGIFEA